MVPQAPRRSFSPASLAPPNEPRSHRSPRKRKRSFCAGLTFLSGNQSSAPSTHQRFGSRPRPPFSLAEGELRTNSTKPREPAAGTRKLPNANAAMLTESGCGATCVSPLVRARSNMEIALQRIQPEPPWRCRIVIQFLPGDHRGNFIRSTQRRRMPGVKASALNNYGMLHRFSEIFATARQVCVLVAGVPPFQARPTAAATKNRPCATPAWKFSFPSVPPRSNARGPRRQM